MVSNPDGRNQHGGRVSGADIVRDLRRVADMLGETPTAAEYDEHGEYSRHPISRRFESWNDALRAAGLALNREHRVPDERLLRDLRLVALELGRPPSWREYLEHGQHAPGTLQRRFGGWVDALESAALEVKGSREGGRPSEAVESVEALTPEDLGLNPIGVRGGAD